MPVPLLEDPYEAIRQAYLVGTDTVSEPFKGKVRTPESPHIVAPPTCHVEESEGFGTSGARSTSSDSIAPLSPNHPLTHTTPVLFLFFVGPHNLSRPDDCKSDKVTIPEYMSEFITNKDLPEYQFPWGKQDIVVGLSFWLSLSCINTGKTGWLNDHHLDLWIDLMWSLRPPEAD
nr:hypothetical protein [Tanacetum cinerariifolium]